MQDTETGTGAAEALVGAFFEAFDAGDFARVNQMCRVDVRSELVGRSRSQRSDSGLVETLEAMRTEFGDTVRHDWEIVLVAGDHVVVEWERSLDSGQAQTRDAGVSFFGIRGNKIDLFRSYDGSAR